jgi:hypothetical protein
MYVESRRRLGPVFTPSTHRRRFLSHLRATARDEAVTCHMIVFVFLFVNLTPARLLHPILHGVGSLQVLTKSSQLHKQNRRRAVPAAVATHTQSRDKETPVP